MSIKFLFLFFLIYLSSTYCSECTEKTIFEEGESKDSSCYELSTESYFCHYNKEKDICEELTCDNSPAKHCHNIPSIFVDDIEKKCIKKSDNTGCEYKTCEDLTSDCGRFETDDPDKICTLNSSDNICEIKSCSSLTENCDQLTPFNDGLKCALISKGQCGITNKDCEEYDYSQCEKYASKEGEPLTRCAYDPTLKRCAKFTCEELSNTECSKFEVYETGKVCAPFGNNCKIQSCPDFSSDICETIEFSNPADRCVNSETGCTFTSCYNYDPQECEKYIPVTNAYKCFFNSYYGQCEFGYKDCEELSKDECDLFNMKDNMERTHGKKCVYSDDEGKCVLNSKKLEFSTFILLFILLLF